LKGDPDHATYQYGRFNNPTWSALEAAIGALEGGVTRIFPSGMAAVSAVLFSLLKPGDRLVLPSDGYFAVRSLARDLLSAWGVDVREAPTAGDAQAARLDGAAMLWLETPSNPHLDVCDIALLSALAHESGAVVVVDNTTATPLIQQPLSLGADISLASDTKAFNGHSDILLGHVSTSDLDTINVVGRWRTLTGAISGPMEAWLAHRGLASIGVRLARQQETAQQLAELLENHPVTSRVRYPGLPGDPSNPIASKQMSGYGFIIGFCLADRRAVQVFLEATRFVYEATSFGGLHTTAERRGRWGTDDVPEGFIRLSVGCEDPEDLLEDVGQALDEVLRS
jgi:cystathionine gamma-lyase